MINLLANPELFYKTAMKKKLDLVVDYESMELDTMHSLWNNRGMEETVEYSSSLQKGDISIYFGYFFTSQTRKSKLRKGKTYGGELDFSTLFEYLVDLNNGIDFIDEYFNSNYFRKEFSQEVGEIIEDNARIKDLVQSAPLRSTDTNKFDKRFKETKELARLTFDDITYSQAAEVIAERMDAVAGKVKRHLQQSLSTGKIPLTFKHKESTIKRRRYLGLTPLRAFYATGQLIDNIVIAFDAERLGYY